MPSKLPDYFQHTIQLTKYATTRFGLEKLTPVGYGAGSGILFYRRVADRVTKSGVLQKPLAAAQLNLYASLLNIYRYLIDELVDDDNAAVLADALGRAGLQIDSEEVLSTFAKFYEFFPGSSLAGLAESSQHHIILRELLLLDFAASNRAVDPFRILLDDRELASESAYTDIVNGLEKTLSGGPLIPAIGLTITDALRVPVAEHPDSLAAQIGFIHEKWGVLLPPELMEELLTAFDILDEEQRQWSDGGSGPTEVLQFGSAARVDIAGYDIPEYHGAGHHAGYEQPEYEAFSADADWMSNVVMIAKMTHVWLDQLSRQYCCPVTRLDQIPDAELDRLAGYGFTGLWLIGVWERSSASRRIKQLCGNSEAHASAYSLYDYTIAEDLGGEPAFLNLKQRSWQRGIRLASDMVPNHTGIHSRWVMEHPDWFVQAGCSPFPTYQFNGENLCDEPGLTIQIEDGYWNKQDAAVVFRMIDHRDGTHRYIYHGNDGTSIPWNDTAQLNYLLPQVREAVMQTILHVARLTPIIRFDAAMTLAKKHYQRLWFPQRGLGGGVPSRAEHAMSRDEFDAVFPVEFWREVVDRVAVETPDTLLLAEAFWMMEGYFVRTLGMHRVYNSAFMNMLKQEENAKYRQTIKNVLEFNPEILKRFVNFMNNPDEKTAVEQFGTQGKYFGACVLLSTMPGLPMFGHGQVEGFHEKYGMEYRRAYKDESVDLGLVKGHELWIFPLLKRRWLFSGSVNFALYDFCCHDSSVDENVFAYSNRAGEQRALVIYNNSYSRTAGWINTASPVVTGTEGEASGLYTSSLGEALGVPDNKDCFLVFKDISNGKEFIRNAADLCRNGLYAELKEYEFHVFLDFRLVYDDQNGMWLQLTQKLAGAGVDSIEEEKIQIENQTLITAFEACLDAIDTVSATPELFDVAINNYCELLPDVGITTVDLESVSAMVIAAHSRTISCKSLRLLRNSGVSKKELSLDDQNRRLALAVVMARMLVIPIDEAALKVSGLGLPLSWFIAGNRLTDINQRKWYTELCSTLAVAWELWSVRIAGIALPSLLNNRQIADFLLVHEDAGTAWFNKERFEILINWLALFAAFDHACGTDETLIQVQELKKLAMVSGYRLQIFSQMLESFKGGC